MPTPHVTRAGHFRNTLHNDPYDNFLCVVRGEKHVLHWPPEMADAMYYAERADVQALFSLSRGEQRRGASGARPANTAGVNPSAPDLERFPRFAEAAKATSYCRIAPGDCFFLPSGVHHHVFSQADADEGYHLAVNVWIDRDATLAAGEQGGAPGAESAEAPSLARVAAVMAEGRADGPGDSRSSCAA